MGILQKIIQKPANEIASDDNLHLPDLSSKQADEALMELHDKFKDKKFPAKKTNKFAQGMIDSLNSTTK